MYDESLFGAYAPITTPFDANGEIAYDKLEENVSKWAQSRLTGLVVLGSNGEGVYLTEAERGNVWQTVKRVLPTGKKMIAGTGCESTYATAKMNDVASEAGADAVLVITPNYYRSKMDNAAMLRHYTTLAEQSSRPVFIYNMPGNTGVDLSPDIILEIAEHPNIIGVKDSSGNIVKMGTVIPIAPNHFRVYAGSASFLYPAVALGAVGGVMALGNIAPNLCADLYEYAATGQHDKARELQLKLIPLNTAVTSGFGIPALKQGLDWLGYYGGPVRSPLGPLNDTQKTKLRELMVSAGVLSG